MLPKLSFHAEFPNPCTRRPLLQLFYPDGSQPLSMIKSKPVLAVWTVCWAMSFRIRCRTRLTMSQTQTRRPETAVTGPSMGVSCTRSLNGGCRVPQLQVDTVWVLPVCKLRAGGIRRILCDPRRLIRQNVLTWRKSGGKWNSKREMAKVSPPDGAFLAFRASSVASADRLEMKQIILWGTWIERSTERFAAGIRWMRESIIVTPLVYETKLRGGK